MIVTVAMIIDRGYPGPREQIVWWRHNIDVFFLPGDEKQARPESAEPVPRGRRVTQNVVLITRLGLDRRGPTWSDGNGIGP